MKQITIYDLLPLLKKGWVSCEKNGEWVWHKTKPRIEEYLDENYKKEIWWTSRYCFPITEFFNIAPFDGDWKDSLIKVEHKEEE